MITTPRVEARANKSSTCALVSRAGEARERRRERLGGRGARPLTGIPPTTRSRSPPRGRRWSRHPRTLLAKVKDRDDHEAWSRFRDLYGPLVALGARHPRLALGLSVEVFAGPSPKPPPAR
jgi:hypothetical protein